MAEVRKATVMNEEELYTYAKEIQAPFHLLKETARLKRLPVVNFAAGGIATPGASPTFVCGWLARTDMRPRLADAALMMQLGCDGGKMRFALFIRICTDLSHL